jgi:hypothetical protein
MNGSFVRKIDPNVNKRQKKKSRKHGTKLQSRKLVLILGTFASSLP